MKTSIVSIVFLGVALVDVANAIACPVWAGMRCGRRKRDGFEVFARAADWDAINADLVKRQGSIGGSAPSATTYLFDPLPSWAALPGSSCGFSYTSAGGTTTAICPYGFKCNCQPGGSSCIPSTAPSACTAYSHSSEYDICDVRWTTTIKEVASAYGQCGGFTDSSVIAGSAWTTNTKCPEGYGCACRGFWYSQCLPTTQYTTGCPVPTAYWACPTTITKSPGPYSQCGGICWDLLGSSNACGAGYSCWTKTSDGYQAPGQYAMCHTKRPETPKYQFTPESLCYPVPYTFTPGDRPLCAGATPGNTPTGQQTLWGQCGGMGWEGQSSCSAGYACEYQNQYYSQCVPASKRKEKKSATPVDSEAALVTPVKKLTQRDRLGPARPGAKPRIYN